MKTISPLFILCFLCGLACRSGETSRDNAVIPDTLRPVPVADISQADTAQKTPDRQNPVIEASPQPTTFKANLSRIAGTVKSVALIDTFYFRLSARIDSATAIGEMPSFAEPGSEVTLAPQYINDSNGSVDVANERNKRLLYLRSLKEGAHFHGKIVRQPVGAWTIVDTDTL